MKIRFGERVNNNTEIRKGPWKAEEDDVLMNHVKKYGPKDWSSIRSKGLLMRTGKSCRLRWVNKLRPNLKIGCKFSLEEERIVIELQGQFGNKWARIATYLQGRTDNDVKNFWSSRQKRLARILQSSVAPIAPSSKSHKNSNNRQLNAFHHVPNILNMEAPKLNPVADEESSSKASCSSASSHFENTEMIKMVPLPSFVNPINYEANMSRLNFIFNNQNPSNNNNEYQTHVTFPQVLKLEQELPVFAPEGEQFDAQLEDPNFLDIFSPGNLGPDYFFDDFPTDMFDHIDPLPSPSEW